MLMGSFLRFDRRWRLHHAWCRIVGVGGQEDGVDEEHDNSEQTDDVDRQLEIACKFGLRLLIAENTVHGIDTLARRTGTRVGPAWGEVARATR